MAKDNNVSDGIRTTTLPSGLVVISERLPHIRSVALGVHFLTGGRDDPSGKAGIAHVIEHMVFRGTPDKDVIAINIAAESHGAELNAFTDKETTCFYGRFPGDQFGPVDPFQRPPGGGGRQSVGAVLAAACIDVEGGRSGA